MKYKTSQSGFSLIETLVAITILLIVMIGPMTISSTAAKGTSFSSEQVTAFLLAQEGAELAQKVRDDLQLVYFSGTNNNPWATLTNTNGTYRSCFEATGCGMGVNTDQAGTIDIHRCNETSSCYLSLDTTTPGIRARYTHDTAGEVTPYKRVVIFQNISANEVKVISRVTWRTGSIKQEQKVEVETRLFNIYGN